MAADPRLLTSGPGPRAMTAGAGNSGVQPSVLRVLGWSVAVLLIASALLPLVPRLAPPTAALTLEIGGELRRTEASAVHAAAAPHLHVDFYDLDLAAVRDAVEALPWVARARIERIWPATVRVHVREHRAVARWGEQALLSDEDALFTPAALDAELAALPRLDGPDGQQAEVRAAFARLRAQLAGTPFAPARLAQNARGEWTAVTADGIELRLGRGAPLDAAALLAGPVHTALAGRLTEVAYVDLHYFNGFAVGWRERSGDARSPDRRAEGRNE